MKKIVVNIADTACYINVIVIGCVYFFENNVFIFCLIAMSGKRDIKYKGRPIQVQKKSFNNNK